MSKKSFFLVIGILFLLGAIGFALYRPDGAEVDAIGSGDLAQFGDVKGQAVNYQSGSGFNPTISEETKKKVAQYNTPRVSLILKEVKESKKPKDVTFDAVVYSVYPEKRSFQIMDIKTAIESSSCCVQCVLDAPKLMVMLMDDKTELPKKLAEIKIKGTVMKNDASAYIMQNKDGYSLVRQRTWGDLQ